MDKSGLRSTPSGCLKVVLRRFIMNKLTKELFCPKLGPHYLVFCRKGGGKTRGRGERRGGGEFMRHFFEIEDHESNRLLRVAQQRR